MIVEPGLLTTETHQLRYLKSWPLPEPGPVGYPGFSMAGLRDITFPEDAVEDAACVSVAAG